MGGRAGPDQGDDAARADGVTDGVESTESERVRSKHHRGTTTSLAKQAASERATTKRRSERAACYPRAGPLTHLRATEDHVSTELIIMPPRSAFRALLAILPLALSSLALAPGSAAAQSYPDRPIKIIVPIGPAGSYDIVGRLLADQLGKRLRQSVVVENRPGAGTIVGTQAAISAPADGYTLLVGGLSNIVFNAGLYKSLPYDPLNDLVPVALVFNISYALVGAKTLPYATPTEVVEAAKKNPGKLSVANIGVGTGQHIVGAAFQKFTGTQLLEVPYRGPTAAYPDLLSGRVDLFFDSMPSALLYITS